jgi:hypothetical protein
MHTKVFVYIETCLNVSVNPSVYPIAELGALMEYPPQGSFRVGGSGPYPACTQAQKILVHATHASGLSASTLVAVIFCLRIGCYVLSELRNRDESFSALC